MFFIAVYAPEDIHVEPAIIDKLTEGTIGLFLPNLQKAKGSLNEVLWVSELVNLYEPCHEKTCLWGLLPGKSQTGLLSDRS